MGIYSQPTGTNDIAPGFAHSRWVYQLSSADRAKLRKGETILMYSGSARPNVFNQLPSYQLVQVSAIGEAQPTEIIAYMTVNTQGTTSIIAYLLQYVGYLNSAVGHIKQYGFKNSKERLAQENLSSLTIVDGVLSVSSSGGGSGSSVIQAISTATLEAVDLNCSPNAESQNMLLTKSVITDGANDLSINNDGSLNTKSLVVARDADDAELTVDVFAKDNRLYTNTEITGSGNTLVVNNDGSINVAGISDNQLIGSFSNIASNTTLTTGAETSLFSIAREYKKNCILTVRDASITSTGYYSIIVSSDSGQNYEQLGIVQPLVSLNGTRGGSTTLNLSPYNIIKLINESAGTYNNVYISLYSS